MDPALQTLIGVVAGGATTYVSQRGLDRRRERHDEARGLAEAERRELVAAAELRGAARLVLTDLLAAFNLLRSTRESGAWWVRLRLPTRAWETHCGALSKELDDEAFRAVGTTFSVAENWNQLAAAAEKSYWLQPRLRLRGQEGLAPLRDQLLDASSAALVALMALALPSADPNDPLRLLVEQQQESNLAARGNPS